MTTSAANFTSGVADLTTSVILSPIITYLRDKKGVEVTLEELVNALQIPVTTSHTRSNTIPLQFPAPSPLTAGTVPQVNGKGKTKKTTTAATGLTCTYVFTRGKDRGLQCDKDRMEGSLYCKNCARKKSAGGPGTSSSKGSGKATPPTQANGGVDDKQTELTCVEIKERPGLFLTSDLGFDMVIKQVDEDTILALGVLLPDKSIRPLTDPEKKRAMERQITVEEEVTPSARDDTGGSAIPVAQPEPVKIPNAIPAPVASLMKEPTFPSLAAIKPIAPISIPVINGHTK
jgi:hypothetical protein